MTAHDAIATLDIPALLDALDTEGLTLATLRALRARFGPRLATEIVRVWETEAEKAQGYEVRLAG